MWLALSDRLIDDRSIVWHLKDLDKLHDPAVVERKWRDSVPNGSILEGTLCVNGCNFRLHS